jgi:glycosyltransferase involved in cell wall biosynthesis
VHKILIVNGSYLPGFKGGGPIRSIANLIDWLGDEFRFRVLTPDRDYTDPRPYDSVIRNAWQRVGKAQVMYLSPDQLRIVPWNRLLSTIDYDLLYLNSFFSTLTVRTLLLRRVGRLQDTPLIIAPRGEFSPGALSLKRWKKWLYILTSKRFGLFKEVLWHATSTSEREHIIGVMRDQADSHNPRIAIAPNLSPAARTLTTAPVARITKDKNSARLIFLSRIVPKKNLKGALEFVADLRGSIVFDIYGPIEDTQYWEECQLIIRKLPSNVEVNYRGVVKPDEVVSKFAQYHAFVFPTLGENFGHVILEALYGGCLVLTSDETPWQNLDVKGVGWDISLTEPESYQKALDELIKMDNEAYQIRSQQAFDLATATIKDASPVQAHRELFLQALKFPTFVAHRDTT